MSMHKIPLTPLEEEGLRLHRLPIGTPSQRSDTFRQGVAWGIGEAKRLIQENERLRKGVDVDWLSNVIRSADGNHSLGAGALAEKIVEAIDSTRGAK